MLKKVKQWLKGAKLGKDFVPVESIVVYCSNVGNYIMCFRKKGSAVNFKCPLCNKYVPGGDHIGCYLV